MVATPNTLFDFDPTLYWKDYIPIEFLDTVFLIKEQVEVSRDFLTHLVNYI